MHRAEPVQQSKCNAPLHTLTDRQCRFPIHEDHTVAGWHIFCGKPVVRGSFFCEEHHARCWNPRDRRHRR